MARIRNRPESNPSSRFPKLVDELATELRADRPNGQPFISEHEFPRTRAVRVTVIWDKWQDVPSEDRYATILEAYLAVEGKEFCDRIAIAIGLTVPEAYESGMLPYHVMALLRPDDPVSLEQVREAVLKEGATELFGSNRVQLRFATLEEAEAAVDRLKRSLPGSEPIWQIAQEVARIADSLASA